MDPKTMHAKAKSWLAHRGRGKGGSLLSAVEDIQKLSPEAMQSEFQRMLEGTHANLRRLPNLPCGEARSKLSRCLKQSPHVPFQCHAVMDAYQMCVLNAMQDRVDELALEPMEPPPPLPPMPAKPELYTPQRRRRFWYKPWTWLQ